MQKSWLWALVAALLVTYARTAAAMTASQLSQYGITWSFDQAYEYGQFANGDYWVIGPVTVTEISPDFDGTRHGWDVNPLPSNPQGYDARAGDYAASDRPSLPYVAQPGSSIVKALSLMTGVPDGSGGHCLQTAAVLTVLAAPPPDNGASVFRPPYVGTSKPYYSVSSIQWSLLTSLNPVANTPNLGDIAGRLGRVQLDHLNGATPNGAATDYGGVPDAQLDPTDNMFNYGPTIENDNSEAILRLLLNDAVAAKTQAMIAVIQGGIDRYFALKNGQMWPAGAGYMQGRKISIAFAAVMLDDPQMKAALAAPVAGLDNFFMEDASIWAGVRGQGLFDNPKSPWGESPGTSPNYDYYWSWERQTMGVNDGSPDPYGFIDGSINAMQAGDAYQLCCTSMSFKGPALIGYLLPQIYFAWGHPEFFNYVDRWVTHGLLTQPDPCAPLSQGGGPDPANPGRCILDPDLVPGSTMTSFSCQSGKQCGRFPEDDGMNADQSEGPYSSAFVDAMWSAYRNTVGVPTDGGAPPGPPDAGPDVRVDTGPDGGPVVETDAGGGGGEGGRSGPPSTTPGSGSGGASSGGCGCRLATHERSTAYGLALSSLFVGIAVRRRRRVRATDDTPHSFSRFS